MTDSLADEILNGRWDSRFRHKDPASNRLLADKVRALKAEQDKWEKLYKRRDTDYVRMIEAKNDKICELESELNQCLTVHATLNDQVCVLATALAKYRYTPQAYDVMWDKVIALSDQTRALEAELETGKRVWQKAEDSTVELHNLRNENDELKAENKRLHVQVRQILKG